MEMLSTPSERCATYIVECFLPGVTPAHVVAAAGRARASVAQLRHAGSTIEYLGALLMPGDEVVFHLFRAPDGATVHEAGTDAALGFIRVLESLVIQPTADRAEDARG